MKTEISILSSKFRRGTITPEEERRLSSLEAEERASGRTQPAKNWWNLPIAARMWRADARDVER